MTYQVVQGPTDTLWRRFVCRMVGHDLYALHYPPHRVSECLRCGIIVEEPYNNEV